MNIQKQFIALGMSAAIALPSLGFAADSLTAAQQAEVKKLIGSYLKENPEVVIEAIQTWRKQQDVAEAAMIKEAISELMKETPTTQSPVWGNPEGDVTVVEFFDYNCPYCKKVFPSMKKLIADDGNIKVVMKELPVLGENSVYAARAALAAQKQGKYEQFHAQMMNKGSRLSPDGVMAAAGKVGINLDQLKKDMESADVQQELERVSVWAERLGITGTPAFAIGDKLIPGAIDGNAMKRYVELARKNREKQK
jgi:protein-disulfide isomerase